MKRTVYILRMSDIVWSLRPATADDAAALTDIVVAATKAQQRWPTSAAEHEAQWRANFLRRTRESLRRQSPVESLSVIDVNGPTVGRLRILRHPATTSTGGSIELAGMQLLPALQGRGIGSTIIRDLQREAQHQGVPLRIGVEKDNPRARALYERLGCALIGETDDEFMLVWQQRPL